MCVPKRQLVVLCAKTRRVLHQLSIVHLYFHLLLVSPHGLGFCPTVQPCKAQPAFQSAPASGGRGAGGGAGEGRREGHRDRRNGDEEVNRDREEAFPPSQIRFPADPSLPPRRETGHGKEKCSSLRTVGYNANVAVPVGLIKP